ncbi:MAG TPA: lipid IV(A) 3-deoxy-D-manno-octulosonic acid transferase [Candidatus Macondimonas sp.]|nr:lipid IV(A) 3-deoxy-D-manno-octulosonic acid transferase [Candidatus Macondimonas sp.]
MFRRLYTLLLALLLLPLLALFAWRAWRRPEYRDRWWQRLGLGVPAVPAQRPCVWVHAVSVGEVVAATALIKRMQLHYPDWTIMITTLTPTGAERVRRNFGDTVIHHYLPLDLPWMVGRLLDRLRPRLVIVMETELWPNLLAACSRRQIPVLLANARISERSLGNYLRLRSLMHETLASVTCAAAQSAADGERLAQLGLERSRILVTGNLKFDREPRDSDLAAPDWRAGWGPNRRVWIAGSTHEGEDGLLLDALNGLWCRWPDLLLVLVPRHPQRFEAVRALLDARGIRYARRSAGQWPTSAMPVFLVDTMGELGMLYEAADFAFIGGSLVPVGGHNALEAAAHAVPVLTGPSTFNFRDIYAALREVGAAVVVDDAESLAHGVEAWLKEPQAARRAGERGQRWMMDNRGALDRLWAVIETYMGGTPPAAHEPRPAAAYRRPAEAQ